MSVDVWVALIAALFGGAGLKGLEVWLDRPRQKTQIQEALRKELREENIEWKKREHEQRAEVDRWRDRYYALLEHYMDNCWQALRGYLRPSPAQIKQELDAHEAKDPQ